MAKIVDLTVQQGADFNKTLTVTNNDGTAYNLTNCTLHCDFKRSPYTIGVIPVGVYVLPQTSSTLGQFTLLLQKSITKGMTPTRWMYDVTLTDVNGTIRVFEGLVYIQPGITGKDGEVLTPDNYGNWGDYHPAYYNPIIRYSVHLTEVFNLEIIEHSTIVDL